jgi:hypothetical protein
MEQHAANNPLCLDKGRALRGNLNYLSSIYVQIGKYIIIIVGLLL